MEVSGFPFYGFKRETGKPEHKYLNRKDREEIFLCGLCDLAVSAWLNKYKLWTHMSEMQDIFLSAGGFMRFLMIVALLSAFTLSACASMPNKTPVENSYYGKASAGFATVPKDDAAIIADILSKGWKENANIIKLLKDNSASLELFRKATLETNGGSVLGDMFNLDSSSKPPYLLNLPPAL
jgi:hypothetical protein